MVKARVSVVTAVVVPMGWPAVHFAQKYRSRLFPDTPMILGCVDERALQSALLTTNDAVMAVRADPRLRGVRFGDQIEATAWYVLAEALSNVVKHARASEVEVSLSQADGRLGLVIRDDGRGFDPAATYAGHLGLTTMRSRAAEIGAQMSIDSAPERGTRVLVQMPIPDSSAAA